MRRFLSIVCLLLCAGAALAATRVDIWLDQVTATRGTTEAPAALPIWISEIMLLATSPAPVAVTASSEINASYKAHMALSAGSAWVSAASPAYPVYHYYDAGSGNLTAIRRIEFRPYKDGTMYGPSNWSLQVSADTSTWATVSGGVLSSSELVQVVMVASPVSARYARLVCSNSYGSLVGLWRLQYSSARAASTVMTASNAPAGFAVEASTAFVGGYDTWKMFDGWTQTRWAGAAEAGPLWVEYYSATAQVFNAVSYSGFSSYNWPTFACSASTDRVTWSPLTTGTCSYVNERRLFAPFTNSTPYNYYRIYATPVQSSIWELQWLQF